MIRVLALASNGFPAFHAMGLWGYIGIYGDYIGVYRTQIIGFGAEIL